MDDPEATSRFCAATKTARLHSNKARMYPGIQQVFFAAKNPNLGWGFGRFKFIAIWPIFRLLPIYGAHVYV